MTHEWVTIHGSRVPREWVSVAQSKDVLVNDKKMINSLVSFIQLHENKTEFRYLQGTLINEGAGLPRLTKARQKADPVHHGRDR